MATHDDNAPNPIDCRPNAASEVIAETPHGLLNFAEMDDAALAVVAADLKLIEVRNILILRHWTTAKHLIVGLTRRYGWQTHDCDNAMQGAFFWMLL